MREGERMRIVEVPRRAPQGQPRELMQRASRIRERTTASRLQLIFVEFAGMPRAGKTTCIDSVADFLRQQGFHVHAPGEGASRAPRWLKADDRLDAYNLWTMAYAVTQIVESTYAQLPERYNFVLLDRGLFDAMCWFTYLERRKNVSADTRKTISRFLRIDPLQAALILVLVFVCDRQVAVARENRNRLVPGDRIVVKEEVLDMLREIYIENGDSYEADFGRIVGIDTSQSRGVKGAAYVATGEILTAVEQMFYATGES